MDLTLPHAYARLEREILIPSTSLLVDQFNATPFSTIITVCDTAQLWKERQ